MGLKRVIVNFFNQFGFAIQRLEKSELKKSEDRFRNPSWSQEGEDMILRRLFEGQEKGFFIDVGAHHPIRFSNTYYFYKTGWTGLNIEANPMIENDFRKYRPKDDFLICGVSNSNEKLIYYCFKESALNTFSQENATKYINGNISELIKKVEINVKTLREILEEKEIYNADFLTVDVEGLDFYVIQGIDFSKFRTKIIVVECLSKTNRDEIKNYLFKHNYTLVANTLNSYFFEYSKNT